MLHHDDFQALEYRLASDRESLKALLASWFPNGVIVGDEFCIGNTRGDAGKSLKFNLTSRVWKDFATGDGGQGVIALHALTHTLTQGEAYKALGGEIMEKSNGAARTVFTPKPADPIKVVLEVPPEDAPRDDACFAHPAHGPASEIYHYLTAEGDLWYVQCRYNLASGKKVYCPWTWVGGAWRPEGPPKPKPLYGLERLAAFPDAGCIVVEGEKAAEALKRVIRTQPVLTWWGGAGAPRSADWEPLRGRKVTVWGDADEPGEKARKVVCDILAGLDCQVNYIDTSKLPSAWDAADAVAQGMGLPELKKFVGERKRAHGTAVTTPAPAAPVITPSAQAIPNNNHWQAAGLTLKANGLPHANENNMTKILEYAKQLDYRIDLWWDTFKRRLLYRTPSGSIEEWSDAMDTNLLTWVQDKMGLYTMNVDTVRRVVVSHAQRNPRNCVLEWFDTLEWDETERLKDLMPRGFGSERNPYTEAVGRCFMVGMVARAMRPGCKVDTLPILESEEGKQKSSALRALGSDDWFAEIHDSILSKDFKINIQGKLLIEISELNSFQRTQMNQIKGVISDPSDRMRMPYGRSSHDWPRQNVFVGTTNQDDWNTDVSGEARRFWPIICGTIDKEWIITNRDQLFAEAITRFRANESWWDVPRDAALDEQRLRHVDDPWKDPIRTYCDGKDQVTTSDVMEFALALKPDKRDMISARRVGYCLKALGFKKTTGRDGDRTFKVFRRPTRAPFEQGEAPF